MSKFPNEFHFVFIFSIFGEKTNNEKSSKPSLLKAVAKLFWKEFLLLGILCLLNDVIIRIVQPQLLRQFLLHFKPNPDVNHSDAIYFASGMVILNGLGALIINQLFMTGYHNGMKVRIAICSLIYRKVKPHEIQSLCRHKHFLLFFLIGFYEGPSLITCCLRNNFTGKSNKFAIKRCEPL